MPDEDELLEYVAPEDRGVPLENGVPDEDELPENDVPEDNGVPPENDVPNGGP